MSLPRRALAGVGRTLITSGVLLLLFVAYQLWGTGIAQARSQRQGLDTFEQQLASLGATPLDQQGVGGATTASTTLPGPGPAATSIPGPGSTVVGGVSTTLVGGVSTTVEIDPSTVPSPTLSSPATVVASPAPTPVAPTTPVATSSTLPQVRMGRSQQLAPRAGKTLGIMVIPRINKRQVVVEGSDKESLKTGPGHYPTTPYPGQAGNAGIACHRTTYGAPCFNLDLLRTGDPIFVQTLQGSFRYDVVRMWIVGDKDGSVLANTPGEDVLTLTTCHPKYSAAKRLIVRARLVGPAAASDFFVAPEPVTTTLPPTTLAPTTAPPTNAPTTAPQVAVATVPGEGATVAPTAPPTTLPTSTPPVSDPAAADTIAADGSVDGAIDPGGTGPLWSLGWFHGHRSTWLSTLGWALVCSVIWIGAWLLSRRRKLLARAIIYGAGFVVLFLPVLYLCFENFARLLPDNL